MGKGAFEAPGNDTGAYSAAAFVPAARPEKKHQSIEEPLPKYWPKIKLLQRPAA